MLSFTLLSLLSLALSIRASPFSLEKVTRNQVDVRALRQRLQDKPTRVLTARAHVASPSYCTGANAVYDTDTMKCVCPVNFRRAYDENEENDANGTDIACSACLDGSSVSTDGQYCDCPNGRFYNDYTNKCICGYSFIDQDGQCVCPPGQSIQNGLCVAPSYDCVGEPGYSVDQYKNSVYLTCTYTGRDDRYFCYYFSQTGDFLTAGGVQSDERCFAPERNPPL